MPDAAAVPRALWLALAGCGACACCACLAAARLRRWATLAGLVWRRRQRQRQRQRQRPAGDEEARTPPVVYDSDDEAAPLKVD